MRGEKSPLEGELGSCEHCGHQVYIDSGTAEDKFVDPLVLVELKQGANCTGCGKLLTPISFGFEKASDDTPWEKKRWWTPFHEWVTERLELDVIVITCACPPVNRQAA